MQYRRLALSAATAALLVLPSTAAAQLPTDPIGDVLDPVLDPVTDPVLDPVTDPVLDPVTDPVVDPGEVVDPGAVVDEVIDDPVVQLDPPVAGDSTTGGSGGAVVVQITPPPAPAANPYGTFRVLGRRATLTGRRLRFKVACTASARGCAGTAAGRRVRLDGGAVRRVQLRVTPRRARTIRRSGRARVLLVHTGHTARLVRLRVRVSG